MFQRKTILNRKYKTFSVRLRAVFLGNEFQGLLNYPFKLGKFRRLAYKVLCPVFVKLVDYFLFEGSREYDDRQFF
jgi:hypothetical protein